MFSRAQSLIVLATTIGATALQTGRWLGARASFLTLAHIFRPPTLRPQFVFYFSTCFIFAFRLRWAVITGVACAFYEDGIALDGHAGFRGRRLY